MKLSCLKVLVDYRHTQFRHHHTCSLEFIRVFLSGPILISVETSGFLTLIAFNA